MHGDMISVAALNYRVITGAAAAKENYRAYRIDEASSAS